MRDAEQDMPRAAAHAPNRFLARIPWDRRSIATLLEDAADARPDHALYRWDGRSVTIAEVAERAERLAGGLRAAGVRPGTPVAVMMDNSPQYLDVWFALARLGAVEVPINTAYRGALLAYQLENCGASIAIADPSHQAQLREAAGDGRALRIIVGTGDAEELELRDGSQSAHTDAAIDAFATGAVLYTSGTTGPSKGVKLSHHQQATFGMFFAQIVGLDAGDVVLNYLPHFHIAGKFVSLGCLLSGARMVLTPRLTIGSFWSDVRREGVTAFVAVGGVCNMLAGQPERDDDADNPVRVVYAVPAPAEIYGEFQRRFGCRLVEAYGSTEAGLVLYTEPDEDVPGSCGRPNPHFQIRLTDAAGGDAEEGEILVRGREPGLTMNGYLGMPEATAAALRDGWFHTGDRARVDADGRYWFLDRIKDSIRRRGENISSFEVERLVGAHPDVAEVAAVATPSELGEDDVMVFVVARDGHRLDPEQLFLVCAASMPYFMVPRFYEIVDELERTPTNKVAKFELRRRGVSDRSWDRERAGWRMTREGPVRRGASSAPRTPDRQGAR